MGRAAVVRPAKGAWRRKETMTLDAVINDHYRNLNDNDLHVLHFVKNHLEQCTKISIAELAQQCNVSTTSIIRTVKKLDFSGYSEFKYFLRRENETGRASALRDPIQELNQDIAQTIKVFQQNNLKDQIYGKMERATQLYAFGTGYGQRLMLNEFARCLLNVNKNLILLPATTEFQIARKNFQETDLLFIVSLSGNIDNYKETIHNLGVRDIPMVSVTNLGNNELASITKYNFYFQSSYIDGPMKLNQTSYLTLHLLFHLIYEGYVDYLERRKLAGNMEQF